MITTVVEGMTNQDIFDTVAKHLLAQGKRAMMDDMGVSVACAYRGNEGTKCAAGVLIKDEFYSKSLEYQMVDDGPVWHALLKSGINLEDRSTFKLVRDLQGLHDSSPSHDWHYYLTELAIKHELSPNAIPAPKAE